MENKKINIAELLKDCPPGMELDSTLYNTKVIYQGLNKRIPTHPITVQTEHGFEFELTQYGQIHNIVGSKCVIFPKGKTTWEGFIPPCKFKDGDILYIDCSGDECTYEHNKYIFIFKEISDNQIYCYCYIDEVNKYKKFGISWLSDTTYTPRFATEEEKKKLFDVIRENGYKWNNETKTLEKLIVPKFKVGDKVVAKGSGLKVTVLITNIVGEFYYSVNGDTVEFFSIKDQDNWELVPDETEPKFKDGDIIFTHANCLKVGVGNTWISIFKEIRNGGVATYVDCCEDGVDYYDDLDGGKPLLCMESDILRQRLATEEEKVKLFNKIQEHGYRWNVETKTLEKLVEPKFKVGDVVQDEDGYRVEIIEVNIDDECYGYISKISNGIGGISFKEQDNWELVSDEIKPKFKVGDRVKHKQSFISGTITNIDDDCYKIKYDSGAVSFAIIKDQDDWELVSDGIEPKFKVGDKIRMKGNPNYIYTITGIKENKSGCGVTFDLRFSEQDKNCNWFPKFDISTLKPFESRVLVRNFKGEIWKPAIFGCFAGKTSPYYVLGGIGWKYCIPYEGNENLCGKKDDCKEYYKTWE